MTQNGGQNGNGGSIREQKYANPAEKNEFGRKAGYHRGGTRGRGARRGSFGRGTERVCH